MAPENNGLWSQEIKCLKENLKDFYIKEGHCFGHFIGEEKKLGDFLDHFQSVTSTCFIRAEYHSKEKGHKRMSLGALPVFENKKGNVPIKVFGHPFTIQSNEVKHCIHGTAKKDSRSGSTYKSYKPDLLKESKVRSSVKRNCTAIMHIRGIKVYKDYFVDPKFTSKNNFKNVKTKTLKNIRNTLEENVNHPFTVERRFYLKIPLSNTHSGHQVGECLTPVGRKIDERVENKIYDLVRCNVKNVAEIQRCLIRFVKDDLFGGVSEEEKPKKGNKRYYPRRSDIRTHVFKAISSVEEARTSRELAVNLLNLNPSEWDEERFENDFLMSNKADAGNDDANAGNDDADAGNDDANAGNNDANASNDDADAGYDDANAGNDDDVAGNDDANAGNDDDDVAASPSSVFDELTFLEENLNHFHTSEYYCFGYFVGEEKQLEDFLDHFQLVTSTCFIRAEYHSREKGHKRMSSNTRPIFEDRRGNIPIHMFGNPFLVMSSEVRHCLHGTTKKDSRSGSTYKSYKPDLLKERKVRTSVKRNCTAIMHIRGIEVYKDYFVDPKFTSKNNLKSLKTKTLKNIRNTLEENVNHPFTVERRFYLKIPLSNTHSGHQVGECLTPVGRKIDERVENKIYDLVRCNVKNVAEIQRCLIRFVKNDLFGGVHEEGKPRKGNKRYYPRRSDIRTHISKAIKGNLL